jgi:cytoskeletal protein CcmA (bactofilin family)
MLNAPKQGHPPATATSSPADTTTTFTERRVAAWVGKALRVEGRIISSEDLTIDGSVEGSIELGNHTLTIGRGATVKADLTARAVTISGSVTGTVKATERVELHSTGSVEGDINAPRFVMDEGATVRGKIDAGTRKKRD